MAYAYLSTNFSTKKEHCFGPPATLRVAMRARSGILKLFVLYKGFFFPNKKEHCFGGVLLFLSRSLDIIGAEVLNCRVRNGIGCCHFARTTKTMLSLEFIKY